MVPLLIILIYEYLVALLIFINDGKLEPRAKKAIFLGYIAGVKGYRSWCLYPKLPIFVFSRDVTFDGKL